MRLYKISALFCLTASILWAEPVELRSPDGRLTFRGEVLGFDGTIIAIETAIGIVRVPAAEVICYGKPCLTALGNAAPLDQAEDNNSITLGSAIQQAPFNDEYIIGFENEKFASIFSIVSQAFTVASTTTLKADVTDPDQVTLSNPDGSLAATLLPSTSAGSAANVRIGIKTIRGPQDATFTNAAEWVTASRLSYQMLALDAYAVMVSPDAGIDAISMQDLADIYAGEVTNWAALGGADQPIVPLQTPSGTKVRRDVVTLVTAPAGKTISDHVLTMTDRAGIIRSIPQFPGSIAILPIKDAIADLTIPVAGNCETAVEPTPFNIISGDYPLLEPIMANHAQVAQPVLPTEMFDFAATDVVQDLLAQDGYYSQTITSQPQETKTARLNAILTTELPSTERANAAAMFQTLLTANRLSTTFIGNATSAAEGAWNRANMTRLVAAAKSGAFDGQEIMFIGVAGGNEEASAAVTASRTTAQDVHQAFEQAAGDINNDIRVTNLGFGSIAPATCYDNQVADSPSTRVEIWVRDIP